jgi:hypothetical protein
VRRSSARFCRWCSLPASRGARAVRALPKGSTGNGVLFGVENPIRLDPMNLQLEKVPDGDM